MQNIEQYIQEDQKIQYSGAKFTINRGSKSKVLNFYLQKKWAEIESEKYIQR